MNLHVTAHAIARFQERVANLAEAEIVARLDTPRIRKMVEFGATEIILGTGHHIVVRDNCVLTVRPKPFTKRRGRRPTETED